MRFLIATGLSTALGASIVGYRFALLGAVLFFGVLAVFLVLSIVEGRASK